MTKDYLSGITSEGKEKKTAYDEMAVSAMQIDNGVPKLLCMRILQEDVIRKNI